MRSTAPASSSGSGTRFDLESSRALQVPEYYPPSRNPSGPPAYSARGTSVMKKVLTAHQSNGASIFGIGSFSASVKHARDFKRCTRLCGPKPVQRVMRWSSQHSIPLGVSATQRFLCGLQRRTRHARSRVSRVAQPHLLDRVHTSISKLIGRARSGVSPDLSRFAHRLCIPFMTATSNTVKEALTGLRSGRLLAAEK